MINELYFIGLQRYFTKYAAIDPIEIIAEALKKNPNLDIYKFVSDQNWPKRVMMGLHPDLPNTKTRLPPNVVGDLDNIFKQWTTFNQEARSGTGPAGPRIYTKGGEAAFRKTPSRAGGAGSMNWDDIFRGFNQGSRTNWSSGFAKDFTRAAAEHGLKMEKMRKRNMMVFGLGVAASLPALSYMGSRNASLGAQANWKRRKERMAREAAKTTQAPQFAKAASWQKIKKVVTHPIPASATIGAATGAITGYVGEEALKNKPKPSDRAKRALKRAIYGGTLGTLFFGLPIAKSNRNIAAYQDELARMT